MKFTYRISLEDYREAQTLIQRLFLPWLRPLRWLFLALLAVILLLMLYAYTQSSEQLHALSRNMQPLVVIGALFLLSPLLMRFQAKRAYERNQALHREISFDLNNERFEAVDGAGAKNIVPWDHYDRFLEGKRVFVVGNPSKLGQIISKSTLNAEQTANLRELLATKIRRQ